METVGGTSSPLDEKKIMDATRSMANSIFSRTHSRKCSRCPDSSSGGALSRAASIIVRRCSAWWCDSPAGGAVAVRRAFMCCATARSSWVRRASSKPSKPCTVGPGVGEPDAASCVMATQAAGLCSRPPWNSSLSFSLSARRACVWVASESRGSSASIPSESVAAACSSCMRVAIVGLPCTMPKAPAHERSHMRRSTLRRSPRRSQPTSAAAERCAGMSRSSCETCAQPALGNLSCGAELTSASTPMRHSSASWSCADCVRRPCSLRTSSLSAIE
mmetsp:Transcript_87648/g.263517  ORF Transcript_87648/g.263517 Transcript_87648/m.263517 type:complete len:275 (+) Transcript_87648:140-964(+)